MTESNTSSLCKSCRRANVDCPIWEPGFQTFQCVEYRPFQFPNQVWPAVAMRTETSTVKSEIKDVQMNSFDYNMAVVFGLFLIAFLSFTLASI